MHVGSISHPDNPPHHRQSIAPSAIAPGQKMFTAMALQELPTPNALATDEIKATTQDFRHAARRAVEAGAAAASTFAWELAARHIEVAARSTPEKR